MQSIIRFFQALIGFRKSLILLTVLLTAFAFQTAKERLFTAEGELIVDSTVEPFMARGSGTYEYFKEMREVFGSEEVMVVALHPQAGSRFDYRFFTAHEELRKQLEVGLPAVEEVTAVTNIPRIDGNCVGKSFFHVEGVASVCEPILEKYAFQLECLKNPPAGVVATDSSEDGLAGDLDEDFNEDEEEDSEAGAESDLDEDFNEDHEAESVAVGEGSEGELDSGPDEEFSVEEEDDESYGEVESEPEAVLSYSETNSCTPDMLAKSEAQIISAADQQVASVFEEIKDHELIRRDLISPSYATVALLVKFSTQAVPSSPETQEALQRILKAYSPAKTQISYSGQARTEYLSAKTIVSDIARILPWSLGLIVLTLALTFRSIRGVLIPVVVVMAGIIWTFGFIGLTGFQLNMVTMVLAPLLISVGSAYIIHFMNQYYHEVNENPGMGTDLISRNTIEKIAIPMVVTALTTLAGFAALSTSPIPAVKEVGLFACFGIAAIILLSLSFVPALLTYLPLPKAKQVTAKPGIIDQFLTTIGNLVGKYSVKFIFFWVAVTVVAFVGMMNVTVNSQAKNFAEDSSIEMDLAFIQSSLAGTTTLRLVFSGKDAPEQLQTAQAMYGLQNLKQWILQAEEENLLSQIEGLRVDKVYSAVEYLDLYRNGMDALKDEEVVSFFEESEKQGFPRFLSPDGDLLQMNIRMKTDGTSALLELREALDPQVMRLLPELAVQYTGSGVLSSESADNIATGQIQSLLTALGIIFVLLSAMFLSFRMGLIALYPNVVAIAAFFGTLGWLDIPIGVTISIIASIALGIGVDDTIHFLSHFNENLKKTHDEKQASLASLQHLGRPMICTTIALGLGFAVFASADMGSQVLFGVLTAYTLTICLITDLNFLPSVMVKTKLMTAWDYVSLNYSQTFIESIGLFRGMNVRQTKLMTLSAYPKKLAAGELLFSEGELGHDLYIIMSGGIDIYLDQQFHGENKVLAQLPPGVSFGEMGLFRHMRRSASAQANQDTKLLVLNEKVLTRLQKRYPKIASLLFKNLARRLAALTKNLDLKSAEQQLLSKKHRSLTHFLKFWADDTEDTPLLEVVDQIIADGKLTQDERKELFEMVYKDGTVSKQEQEQLDRLKQMIENGELEEVKPVLSDIFQDMSHHQLNEVCEFFHLKEIPAHVRLWTEGDYGDSMLVVLEGDFNLNKQVDGQNIVMRTATPGDLVGAISILGGENQRTSTLESLSPAKVLFVDMAGLDRLYKAKPKLATQLYFNIVCFLSNRLEQETQILYEGSSK